MTKLSIAERLRIEDSMLFRRVPQQVHKYLWEAIEHVGVNWESTRVGGTNKRGVAVCASNLDRGLIWAETPQGHKFWSMMHDLLDGSLEYIWLDGDFPSDINPDLRYIKIIDLPPEGEL